MKVKFCVRDASPGRSNDDLFEVLISMGAAIVLKHFAYYDIDGYPYLEGESETLDTSGIDYNVSSFMDIVSLSERLDTPISLKYSGDALHVTVWNNLDYYGY